MTDTRIFAEVQVEGAIEVVQEFFPRLLDGDYTPDDEQMALAVYPVLLSYLNRLDQSVQATKRHRHEEKYGPGGKKSRAPGVGKKRDHRLKLVVSNPDPPKAA